MSGKRTLEQTLQTLRELAESVANPIGLIVVDVRFGQQGRRKSVEVTIFRKNGSVGLSDCETVSRQLEASIDNQDSEYPLIEGAYVLEVQSPGIDRQLKTERDFQLFQGLAVIVQAKEKIGEVGDSFTGTLVNNSDGKLALSEVKCAKANNKVKNPPAVPELIIDIKKVAHVKLHTPSPREAQKALEITTE